MVFGVWHGYFKWFSEVSILKTTAMRRPKNPTGTAERKRNRPTPRTRHSEEHEEFERTIPGRRAPEIEKKHDRVVNEDEQLKVVNQSEDNAQSPKVTSENEESPVDGSKENERLEAADDNNEVNPRSPKVN
jgi:hypothetical protein